MIRPDTTKYRLLEMIGMCGEFPADQLNRLIPSASYAEKLITDLKAEHLIRTHYRDALRGYRLTKAAKEMLLSVSPLRFQCYLTGKNGDDVIQLAFEVDNDSLKDAVQSIRALKMLGSNISMPNKTVVHKYLDEVDEAAKLCGAINTVVNLRDENGQVTGKLKGYNTDGMGYWQALTEEGIDFKGMKMVLIGTGGAATAIAVRGALDGVAEIEIFNIKDKFYSRGEEIVDLINKNTNCKATMNDLADKDLLKEKMHAADLFCDATGVGMHPLEDLSNIPDPSFFKKDLIVTDTVYAPRETVMMKQAKEAGCEKVFNGMGMMLFQALIAIKLYTGKDTPVDYMKEKLGI